MSAIRSNLYTAKRFRQIVRADVLLTHSKVGQLNVSLGVQQHIIQLQVAINNAAGVKEMKGQYDFGRIKAKTIQNTKINQ